MDYPQKIHYIKKLLFILLLTGIISTAWTQSVGEESQSPGNKSVKTMKGTYYADMFVGRRTRCGDVFRQNQYTAAHRHYKCGTYLLVTNPKNQRQSVVLVNDYCPIANVLDMTKRTLMSLGMAGTQTVQVQVLDEAVGYLLWVQQDTLGVDESDYRKFRDKSRHRITPYGYDSKAKHTPHTSTKKDTHGDGTRSSDSPSRQQSEDTIPTFGAEVSQTNGSVIVGMMGDSTMVGESGYDLELITVSTMRVARWEAGRLPSEFQRYVIFDQDEQWHTIKIILQLNLPRNKVIRTQAMLTDLFPESTVIPHVNLPQK